MERLTSKYKEENILNCGYCDGDQCNKDECAADCPCKCEQDAIDRLAAYEDTGLTPGQVSVLQTHPDHAYADYVRTLWHDIGGMERMEAVAKAERENRLLVLPCKPMTTVYVIEHVDCYMDTEACPMLDESGRCNGEGEMPCPLHIVEVVADIDSLAKWVVLNAFGESVFRTREAAEAALKEHEGK